MNFEHILAHHLLDKPYQFMFNLGPVPVFLTKHLVMMWIVSLICIVGLSVSARGRVGAGLLARGGLETIVLYLRDEMLEPIFGHATSAYLPYFLTLFFFILVSNLAGLVPFGSTVTSNVSVTMALALCTFGLIQFAGVKEQGAVSYIIHIVPKGVPLALWPLLFVIEVFGMMAKCISLCIRLFANMIAGHIVSLAFLCLIFIMGALSKVIGFGVSPVSVGLALFVCALDVLVSFLQAYIFTFLTALFVGGAVHPH